VAEKLAEIHKIPFEKIAKQTSQNASELFGFSNLSD
jgi:Tat protein secretion system quality control protein TatD with DNase activity